MTEPVKAPEAVVEVKVEPSVPELSPVEQQAIEQGWQPKEEWVASGKDPEEHRSAKEFVERGELYKSIHTTKRELKQTQAQLAALNKHHAMVFEKAYEQAKTDLRMEKRLAIRNEDFERLEEIETELEKLEDQHQVEKAQLVQTNAVPQIPAEVQAFYNRNPWYMQDKTLRDEADAIGFIHLNNGGTKADLLDHVEKEMKRKFPEKLGIKRVAPNAVAGVNRTNNKPKGALTIEDVPEEMRGVIRRFTESTGMSEADYIKQLKKNGAF